MNKFEVDEITLKKAKEHADAVANEPQPEAWPPYVALEGQGLRVVARPTVTGGTMYFLETRDGQDALGVTRWKGADLKDPFTVGLVVSTLGEIADAAAAYQEDHTLFTSPLPAPPQMTLWPFTEGTREWVGRAFPGPGTGESSQ